MLAFSCVHWRPPAASSRLLPEDLFLPLGADRIVIHPVADRRLRGFARAREATSGATLVADVWLETAEGKPAVLIEGMRFARAEPGTFAATEPD